MHDEGPEGFLLRSICVLAVEGVLENSLRILLAWEIAKEVGETVVGNARPQGVEILDSLGQRGKEIVQAGNGDPGSCLQTLEPSLEGAGQSDSPGLVRAEGGVDRGLDFRVVGDCLVVRDRVGRVVRRAQGLHVEAPEHAPGREGRLGQLLVGPVPDLFRRVGAE